MSGVRWGANTVGTALPKDNSEKPGALGNLQAAATKAAANAYNRRVAAAKINRNMAAAMRGLSLGGKGRRKTRRHRHRRPKMTRKR